METRRGLLGRPRVWTWLLVGAVLFIGVNVAGDGSTAEAVTSDSAASADSPAAPSPAVVAAVDEAAEVDEAETPTLLVGAADGCHPAYSPCVPFESGDALDCSDIGHEVIVLDPSDPYKLDFNGNGIGCES